jgi:hypothetical protein
MTQGIQIAYSGIRQNKKVLFWLFGFVGGMLGALISEFIYVITPGKQTILTGILITALWAGLFSVMIATGLFYAIETYSRRNIDWAALFKKSIPAGFIAGIVSGGIAQAVFGPVSNLLSNVWVEFLFQSACWGILGLILGWWLSKSIPNLSTNRALSAGFIGGFFGGALFIIAGALLDLLPGHMLGVGILGAALGFCLVIVEEQSRSAYLEVHRGSDDTSYFTLGKTPVFIGAGDSDIYVPTVGNRAMSIVIEGGQIIATDHTKGKKKQMTDGNHITIGKIDMVIRTRIEKMKVN